MILAAVGPSVAMVVVVVAVVLAGLVLVTTRNVVHAAISLMVVLGGVAATFMLLGADFLGWTQVIVYIGAIVVLFLFGVMLTRGRLGQADLDAPVRQRIAAVCVAALVFGMLTVAFVSAFGADEIVVIGHGPVVANEELRDRQPGVLARPTTSAELADDLFTSWVLPFEAVSLVLLAALIGAIVLARRDDPTHVLARVQQSERSESDDVDEPRRSLQGGVL